MFDLSDAFVSFAGGLGTLDETFEILTWKQLGLHSKPILISNIAGSASALLASIEACIEMGFAKAEIRDHYEVVEGIEALLHRLA
jgi:predicted Rossmann-fold nucleotide-binding protein